MLITTEDGKPWAECNNIEFEHEATEIGSLAQAFSTAKFTNIVAHEGLQDAVTCMRAGIYEAPRVLFVHQGERTFRLNNTVLEQVSGPVLPGPAMTRPEHVQYYSATLRFPSFATGIMMHDNEVDELRFHDVLQDGA